MTIVVICAPGRETVAGFFISRREGRPANPLPGTLASTEITANSGKAANRKPAMSSCAVILISPDAILYGLFGLTALLFVMVGLRLVVNLRRI